ncbi:MAG: DUF4011 domain-containing protein [Sphingomonas sp.]|nr:DUF4011 domain-containing protein [Sphingomonas sp.]
MGKRPLIDRTSADLGAMADRNWSNAAELKLILAELAHRQVPSARQLREKVTACLAVLAPPPVPVAPVAPRPGRRPSASRREVARATVAKSGRHPPEIAAGALPLPDPSPSPPARKAPPMTDKRRWTEQAVADLRRKLIDLSKKNPLIAFKHGGRATTHLRIIDERPDLLHAHLSADRMRFEALPDEEVTPRDELTPDFRIAYERARLTDTEFIEATDKLGDDEGDARKQQAAERALRQRVRAQLGLPPLDYGKALDLKALALAHGFDPSFDLKPSDEDSLADHHQDDHIRVLLTVRELEKRLKAIYDRYRMHQRETGLHTLFLCLGFVQWYEDETSDTAFHAPVLTLPVQLERRVVRSRYEYTVTADEGGLEVNVALQEKMRQHWGLEPPALRDGETPESYFIRLQAVLAQGRRLSLRSFATLAVLPFPRMILWRDLDPAAWPEAAFAEHPLVPTLLGASAAQGEAAPLDPPDIDAEPWASEAPPLIQPADASQHAALIDAIQGHPLAIEGPPGTGKSQTITNMIAGALCVGKRVLFVAEKQAALSVVAGRLRQAGLGPLILELHGDTAKRDSLYDGLRERLAARPKLNAARLADARAELARKRDLLRRYIALISAPIGALGRTAYQLVWRDIALRDLVSREALDRLALGWTPDDAETLDAATLAERRAMLADFATAFGALGAQPSPWIRATRLPPFDQRQELAAAGRAAAAAGDVATAADALGDLGLAVPGPDGPLAEAVSQLARLRRFEGIDERVARSALGHRAEARSLLAQASRWRRLRDRLAEDVTDPGTVSAAAVAALQAAMGGAEANLSTPAALRADIDKLRQAGAALAGADRDVAIVEALAASLKASSAGGFTIVSEALATLGGLPPVQAALLSATLVDPLALAMLEREAAAARELCDERHALRSIVTEDGFEEAPDELERTADILESSGWWARLTSAEFKAARRRAGRWLGRAKFEREEAVAPLRRLARLHRRAAKFGAESPAKTAFPATLWASVDSDWAAIQGAATALQRAATRLGEARADDVLGQWLACSSSERTRVAAAAQRSAEALAPAIALGLGDVAMAELQAALASRLADAERLDRALIGVGARGDASIFRDGESLVERLNGLLAANDAFASIAAGPSFAWAGAVDQPLDALARAVETADALESDAGPLAIAARAAAVQTPVALIDAIAARAPAFAAAIERWSDARQALEQIAGIDATALGDSWTEVAQALARLSNDEAGARRAADLLRLRGRLRGERLDQLAISVLSGDLSAAMMADAYELLVIRALLVRYLGGTGADLGAVNGLTLDGARRAFVAVDAELHGLEAAAIVAARLRDQAPAGVSHGPVGGYTDMGLIHHELGLKRSKLPLRDLVHRAGAALQALKPVWMMSPSSAAQFLRPGASGFDLLVIDEASQMRPEFALSALMRGTQAVIVGDANQLPPSDFFAGGDADLVDDEEAEEGLTVDTESILDLANQRLRRRRRLRWHYRSQHESLIQYSNREFYGRDLVVFPSPSTDDDLLGIKHVYVGGRYEASVNQEEAQAVIEEAFRLMCAYPERSLGIATMNAKQAELIRAEFDRLVLEQDAVRRYVDAWAGGVEEFFIKNLENVQGDERDIILISTVYGPNAQGQVMQRFGPMNREVGWRRLNVLVTRAKLSTRLFTSLRPEDVKVTEKSSRGVLALKGYLNYAAGGAIADEAGGGEPDSDFEIFVADKLRLHGYQVVPQVGVEGFRIDLGVRHPDFPLGFIAGVECDGARWHSGLSVRDRDRIRQTVLENLGWRIHRIWSTDWFADPDREMAKLLDRLELWRAEAALAYARRPKPATPAAAAATTESAQIVPNRPTAPPPDHVANDPEPARPVKQMRPLDGIHWNEVEPSRRYEVLGEDQRVVGAVEVLSRAMSAPRVYGGQLAIARSEFEGTVARTGERFRLHDIYATVREVARRASLGADE